MERIDSTESTEGEMSESVTRQIQETYWAAAHERVANGNYPIFGDQEPGEINLTEDEEALLREG